MKARKPRAQKEPKPRTKKEPKPKPEKKRSILHSFVPDKGLVEFVIIKTQGAKVWADDPENRFGLRAIVLRKPVPEGQPVPEGPDTEAVLESQGAFFGLDASCVLQAARKRYAPLLAEARGVLRLLSSAEQHLIRQGRAANRRGGRKPIETRHQRGLVLDDETLAMWEEFSGDRSQEVRRLMREHWSAPLVEQP